MKITKNCALRILKDSASFSESEKRQKVVAESQHQHQQDERVGKWLLAEVAEGLVLLESAGLKAFSRAGIEAQAAAWNVVFQDEIGAPIREIDAPRIRTAFRRAARQARKWPSPAEVLELMPPRPQRRALDHLPEPNPERDLAAIKKIQEMLNGGKK